MNSIPSGLNAATNPSLGAFTDRQNRAILIVGLSCSCVSLVATLITLRWFLLMKRLFRHRLVLYLILSDTFKALWYFVFPIVVFTRGPVQSSSVWCQTSGWLLAFGIESSDFAIFLIALHAMLYIFRPQTRIGKGGLYKYRKWIPLVWLGPPAILASLAFINNGRGYVTAGTFCYLPKRPIWYRLALAYIPRYIILFTIFGMYAAISIYVHIKFRSFKEVVARGDTDSNYGSDLERTSSTMESIAPDEIVPSEQPMSPSIPPPPPPPPPPPSSQPQPSTPESKVTSTRPNFARGFSYRSFTNSPAPQQHQEPWDAMNFITSKRLQDPSMTQYGVQAADFASSQQRGSASSEDTRVATRDNSVHLQTGDLEAQKQRQPSEAATTYTVRTHETGGTSTPPTKLSKRRSKELVIRDPLQRTRIAIRNQLRFLFIYPAIYALMWAFPFAMNCTLYSNYYAAHPIFWLQIMATVALSLQATADCLVFSWREKPWRRVDQNSKFSIPFWRRQSVAFFRRMSLNESALFSPQNQSRKGTTATGDVPQTEPLPQAEPPSRNWWEEEGKKRKDSVWMGTDLLSKFTSKQSEGDAAEKLDTIEERNGSV